MELMKKDSLWFVACVGVKTFLTSYLEHFNVIIWTSGTFENTIVLLRSMESKEYLPPEIAYGTDYHIFAQDKCMAYSTSKEASKDGMLYLKSFKKLHSHNICTHDMLLVDDTPTKNNTNHPHNAIHPRMFDPFILSDDYLSVVLLPWLLS